MPAFTPSLRPSAHFGWYSFPVPRLVGGWVSDLCVVDRLVGGFRDAVMWCFVCGTYILVTVFHSLIGHFAAIPHRVGSWVGLWVSVLCCWQAGEWVSWRDTTCMGHTIRSLSSRAHWSRRCRPLRPVWRSARRQWGVWLPGEDLGSRVRDLPADSFRPHQQSVLTTGQFYSKVWCFG